jgi:hypothetical protein
MRPFFRPTHVRSDVLDILAPENWVMDLDSTEFPGAVPGCGQELNAITHPHLMLDHGGMVSMKTVKPGDMVFWHCGMTYSAPNVRFDYANRFLVRMTRWNTCC